MTQGFTNEELRDAAAEAGISPAELRDALVRRDPAAMATVGPAQLETRIAAPPARALTLVRERIEHDTGLRGHHQGEDRFDIVDDRDGVTYDIRVRNDEAGGALVRVEVVGTSGALALAGGGLGGGAALMVLLGLIAGSTLLWLGGLGVAGIAVAFTLLQLGRVGRARRRAEGIAATALAAASEAPR
ncbi:MAG: hypothetical protein U0168_28110 [Nannocystaceae bacterium]